MLQLQPYLQSWASRGFDVYFVTMATAGEMQSFIENNKVSMNVMLDPGLAFKKAYRITGYPTSLVVDQKGIVQDVKLGWGTGSLNLLHQLVGRLCPEG